ncbi:Fic/DOC family protein [Niveispirillum lacus]|uniref:Fic/DOC family protein n=1 Tax=Niveispirillum lacus TaxID=1981099 RepID=UPI001A9C313B|nr:Fic family protein [Niveispirillum lacus]
MDITDQETLDEAELALFLIRADEPLPAGKLDVAHYLSIHRHLFQDVYEWAGEIRSIRVGKAGNWFCYPEYIQGNLARAFREYGDPDVVAELPPAEFARCTAHFLAEINAVHPFREGNGRTQLTFLTLLAANAGYAVNDGVLDPAEVLSAMIESFGGSEDRLAALILAYIS